VHEIDLLVNMKEDLAAIVEFNINQVEQSKKEILKIFTEMDDGIGMPIEHRRRGAKALFNRIESGKDIHLLAIEALSAAITTAPSRAIWTNAVTVLC